MRPRGDFEVIRDPLWNNIRVDHEALGVLDSEPFQRLRFVRQLGHAFLVYPGATHTRFEHALGAYHLSRRVLSLLAERGELGRVPTDEVTLMRLAALLHDVGHYPFSHALEEAGLPSHEDLARKHFEHHELQSVFEAIGIRDAGERIADLISGRSRSPLQGLISGSLDLDKIEYLTRDARMCGVPYGTVDVDRLLHSITLVETPNGPATGIHEKGLSALESLLFAKYQMYRNVYWHHAVRAATAMFKRVVRLALQQGRLDVEWIAQTTDEGLMEAFRPLSHSSLAGRLRRRDLYKRAYDAASADIEPGFAEWIATDPDRVQRVEDAMAGELGLEPGEILIDYPYKPSMLSISDLPVLRRDGRVEVLNDEQSDPRIGIHHVADELHQSARRLRVFVAKPMKLAADRVRDLLQIV